MRPASCRTHFLQALASAGAFFWQPLLIWTWIRGDVSAFANLPISRKLLAAFAAVVGIILVSSSILYDRLRVIEVAKNARIHTTDILEMLQDIMDAMVDQETGVRGYLITGDEKFLEPYHKGIDAYTTAIQKTKELTRDNPAQQNRLDELNELAKNWREIAEREIALMAKPETRAAARGLEGSTVGGKATMDLVRAKVDEIDEVERELLARREAVQNKAFAAAYSDDPRRPGRAHPRYADGRSTHARHRGADQSHD